MDLDKLMKELDEKINAMNEEGINKLQEQFQNNEPIEVITTEIKNINIWESNKKDSCHFLYTIEELISYINNSKDIDVLIQDTSKTNAPLCRLDYNIPENIEVTYTDVDHPITITNYGKSSEQILINPIFFNSHKEIIKEAIISKLIEKIEDKISYIDIPDFLIDEDFINNFILSDKLEGISIYIKKVLGIKFSNKDIEKLQKAYRNIYYDNENISSDIVIGYYSMKNLKENNEIFLSTNLTQKDFENFKYINENTIISIVHAESFRTSNDMFHDERKYFQKLKKIIDILKTHNKTYTIKIDVNNRELFEQSNILSSTPNINFIIDNDLYKYNQEEYLKEEEQLNDLVKPIKESNLSPYEKFIAVYNIVKTFKPYKENENNLDESRYLRYILNNEYIVCVGFQVLLETLLNKVGIPVMNISVSTDDEYKENEGSNLSGHVKNIVKIDDDKYNIHGIFIADSTWDNSMNYDLYRFVNLSFDEVKEASYIEKLENFDLLLDFHNLKEFSEKINFYLKRQMKNHIRPKKEKDKIIDAYKMLFYDILYILEKLDYDKYIYFFNKYNNEISNLISTLEMSDIISNSDVNLKDLDNIYSKFLTEYLKYILPLSNQKIDDSTLYAAIKEVKKTINNHSEQRINEETKEIKEIQEEDKERIFPYSYDPNIQIPNYLATKKRN